MNLTKLHKEAFVRAVMDDVPRHDFNGEYETLIKADMLATALPKVLAILTDPEVSHLVLTGCTSVSPATTKHNNSWYYPYSLGISRVTTYSGYEPSKQAEAATELLMLRAITEQETRLQLEQKINAVISACRTLKAAHERLPEFAKYLPAEEVKGTMLPAIANLAADLMEAGWPKQQAVAA